MRIPIASRDVLDETNATRIAETAPAFTRSDTTRLTYSDMILRSISAYHISATHCDTHCDNGNHRMDVVIQID